MRKSTSAALAVLLSMLASSWAVAAHAAFDDGFTVQVTPEPVRPGAALTVRAKAPTLCAWSVKFNGEVRTVTGRTLSTAFTAPKVTRRTDLSVVTNCLYTVPSSQATISPTEVPGSDVQFLVANIPASWNNTTPVTVQPDGGAVAPPTIDGDGENQGGVLPDTGGPAWWIAVTGAFAVLAGIALVRRRRSRSAETDEGVLAGSPDHG